jgi:hypothetical protein
LKEEKLWDDLQHEDLARLKNTEKKFKKNCRKKEKIGNFVHQSI